MELENLSHKLSINVQKFDFVEREKINGRYLRNRCGRDFLYYALTFYYPEKFNVNLNCPNEIEREKIFGFSMHANLAWTQIQFYRVPKVLADLNLELEINSKLIHSFTSFVKAIISFNNMSSKEAIEMIKEAIDEGGVVGIDIAIDKTGLLDHVMFVYGYDEHNLYIFDTHIEKGLEYEHVLGSNDKRFIMKLSFDIISKRWTRFGRVWKIRKKSSLEEISD